MSVRKIVEIFNRDIRALYVLNDTSYKVKILNNAILFYTEELALQDGHQSKIFTDEEYRLLIKLYKNELKKIYLEK